MAVYAFVYTGFTKSARDQTNHPSVLLKAMATQWYSGTSHLDKYLNGSQVLTRYFLVSRPQQSELLASTSMIGGLLHGNPCEDPEKVEPS